MVKKWTEAGYGRPVLSERVNPERSSIFLPLTIEPVGNVGNDVGNDVGNSIRDAITVLNKTEANALRIIEKNPKASARIISESLGISKRQAERTLSSLRDKSYIVREGGTRGYWVIQ